MKAHSLVSRILPAAFVLVVSAPSFGYVRTATVAHTSVRNANVDVNRTVAAGPTRYDSWGRPVAATASAVAVGTVVAQLPPHCTSIFNNGITYSQCGGITYKPMYSGTSVQYVVVEKP